MLSTGPVENVEKTKLGRLLRSNGGLFLSYLSDTGDRDYMEDRIDIRVHRGNLLMTICDGHGGSECADFVIKEYPKALVGILNKDSTIRTNTAMKRALKNTSDAWDKRSLYDEKYPLDAGERKDVFETLHRQGKAGRGSGTTLLVCYLHVGKRVGYVMSLGDSRAQWDVGGLISGTKDHKPTSKDIPKHPKFPTRIEVDADGTPRLNGELAVGRAIGDNTDTLAGCVPRDTVVHRFQYPKHGLDLILASDGVWDDHDPQVLFQEHPEGSCGVKGGMSDDNMSVIRVVHK